MTPHVHRSHQPVSAVEGGLHRRAPRSIRATDTSHGAIRSAITTNQTKPLATPLGGLPCAIPRPGTWAAQRQVPIEVPYSSSAATTRNTPAYTERERERQRYTHRSGTPIAPTAAIATSRRAGTSEATASPLR